MLQFVVILKALVEVAMFAFLGQGILYILAGSKREQNFVYGIMKTLTSPVTRIARLISPRFVLDQHIWLVAIFLLVAAWVALTAAKVSLVLVPA
ncbi:MAG: hypothetical protein KAX84_15315 [Burkholderiales bacterium]|nr:hypothetical protein [Betaproteobacteria bacterium]MBP8297480.1 hypothetical protein [Burkholderiales bacterium]